MRNAFIKELYELAQENPEVLLLTGDLGFKVFDDFRRRYTDRFLNIGVAEANMAGIAAGLALEGKIPFMYSIAPFATMRCYEQIRNDICFHEANVKIVGVGGGYSYGPNGPTHHALTDIAVMRALPHMTVICPGDPVEAACATRAAASYAGPVYIRLGRSNESVIHQRKPEFTIGKGIIVQEGEKIALLSTGNMLETAMQTAKELASFNLKARVVSLHTLKPLDGALIKDCLRKFTAVFTIEEHSIIGGLASAVAEIAVRDDLSRAKIRPFAAPDEVIHETGSHEYLRSRAGLTSQNITKQIDQYLKEWKLC